MEILMSSVYAFKKPEERVPVEELSPNALTDRLTQVPMRTIAGDKALKSPESSMPRKLRALLSAVDNRAQTQVYVTTLTAFGDVTSMFDALEEIGMVKFVADRNASLDASPRSSPQQALSEDRSLEELLSLPASSPTPTFSAPPPTSNRSQASAFTPPPAPVFRAAPAASPASAFQQFNQSNSDQRASAMGTNIEKVKTLMTDFVLNNFAADAMELTLAIDQIRTYDDLVGSLTQYEAITAKTGKTGLAHMQTIKTLLTK
jgi:hypothetical protein